MQDTMDGKMLICFCFGYTVDDIRQDIRKHGRSRILDRIQLENKMGKCQCASKHPKGK